VGSAWLKVAEELFTKVSADFVLVNADISGRLLLALLCSKALPDGVYTCISANLENRWILLFHLNFFFFAITLQKNNKRCTRL
jgi:hypothetical protein